jgi:6-phosphofructokinase
MTRFGLLTGGGDVPPLNALIASVRDQATRSNNQALGFIKGGEGLMKKEVVPLSEIPDPSAIGGTILKSSRTNSGRIAGGVELALENLRNLAMDALIVVGGDSGSGIMKGDSLGRIAVAVYRGEKEAMLYRDVSYETSKIGFEDRDVEREEWVI